MPAWPFDRVMPDLSPCADAELPHNVELAAAGFYIAAQSARPYVAKL